MKRILYSLHRFLGLFACLFLSMWFITGLVLIYHPFPNISKEDKCENMESISSSSMMPDFKSIEAKIPADERIKKVNLSQFNGAPIFHILTDKKDYRFGIDGLESPFLMSLQTLKDISKKWSDGHIAKIDTLKDREIWIMYNRYIKELPIYKVSFDDKDGHQLYISSQSGEALQFTSFSERMWAYVGAIPHKLYIPALRQNTKLWADTVTVLAIICLLACLTGVYVGIKAYMIRYKKTKKLGSPYKKTSFKWHHILGIIFGIFLITWSISGTVSLRKTPQWITKTHHDIPKGIKGKPISMDKYILDYRTILAENKDVKEIEWTYFQGMPVYNTIIKNKFLSFDASTSEPKELYLQEKDMAKIVKYNHGDVAFETKLIDDYENYYLSWREPLALPVYKISVSDADNSIYYINPLNGQYKYLNDNRKVRKWLFFGLHYFHVKWLMERPVLWTIAIWVLTLGCTAVSLTGVWLSGKYIKRKFRKGKRKMTECK